MTLHLSLSPESEDRLRRLAEAAGMAPEEFARRSLEASLRSTEVEGPDAAPSKPGAVADLLGPGDLPSEEAERRLRAFRAWKSLSRPGSPGATLDDSRESIYEGRGE